MSLGMTAPANGRSPTSLHGRDQELDAVRALVERARQGSGGGCVIAAEAGLGRTTLLRAAHDHAPDFRVVELKGVAAEASMPGAALHRALQELPGASLSARWSDALIDASDTGGDLRLFAAVHRVIVAAARRRPVLFLIDDAERLDLMSLRAWAFAARRVTTTPVLVLFAETPSGSDVTSEFPRLVLGPLDDPAGLRVVRDRVPGIAQSVAEDLVELAGGSPLALVELANALTLDQVAGFTPPPGTLPPDSKHRRLLRQRFAALTEDERRLVMLAVVDDRLDLATVVRAARESAVDLSAGTWDHLREFGLVVVDGDAVRIPGELVRSTLHAESSPAQRKHAHTLLMRVLDPRLHRFQRAWHRAAVATESRDHLADDLHEAASEAHGSGDFLSAFRAFRKAAELTAAPESKAFRLIAAGRNCWMAGRPRRSQALLRQAIPLTASPELRGTAELLRGGIELRGGVPSSANESLMRAADELSRANRDLAVTALILAGEASCVAGDYPRFYLAARRAAELRSPRMGSSDTGSGDTGSPDTGSPDNLPPVRLMLDHFAGMAATFQGEHDKAVPLLRDVVGFADTVRDPLSRILASQAAFTLGDPVIANETAIHAVSSTREDGAAVFEPWALVYRAMSEILLDRYPCAESSALEGLRVAQAIGQQNCAVDHLTILALVAALRGDRETALLRWEAAADGVAMRGLGRPGALSSWAFAAADLAHDRPSDALDRFRLMTGGARQVNPAIRAMAAPHFVEAAIRCGRRGKALQALDVFDKWAIASGSEVRRALAHRCHALVAERPADAHEHFGEAIRLHRSSDTAWELAKTELFYGNWLRRDRKPRAAREFLGDAVKIFQDYQADHWAGKAQAELRAAGEAVHRAPTATVEELTPQQSEISRLVAEGATNREIAAQLFISPRTVDHHLRNIFAKFGIRSRVELARLFR